MVVAARKCPRKKRKHKEAKTKGDVSARYEMTLICAGKLLVVQFVNLGPSESHVIVQ